MALGEVHLTFKNTKDVDTEAISTHQTGHTI